ncbi:Ig-like domain-containing protein [Pseudodesulfovibrio sp.]|uniref:Ig-like domain-containing protein n=1 Tax=Pseudodesulfovibrio sp. TaxID=2035812 RepID=UPI002610DCD2|nr:Ig-like domain-containing protein [Pseudodesulfovibrio sp.]MDD3312461.1 Ig-like domain-containing protein [Pseudodesulfovibrio sp.]
MAEKNAPGRVEERTAPSTSYTVAGSPDDYRYVLRGADLVLIDQNNVEHVFLFVGNIMSLDGRVDMTFSNGQTLHSADLFERSEMVDVQPFYEEEVEWDAKSDTPDEQEQPEQQQEGNTPDPDGRDEEQAPRAEDVQAAETHNLKQQLMQALQENDNTSKRLGDDVVNRNISPENNTNTSDKQGGADDIKPEQITPTLAPPHIALTDDTNSGSTLDSVTNVTTPHFVGTAEPGSDLTLYINDAAVATGKASADGDFLFLLDQTYADGTYSVYVHSAEYGLEAQSSVMTLEIDTLPPALPSIQLAAEYDTGVSGADKLTNEARPLLQGSYGGDTSEAGTTLTIEARQQGSDTFLAIGTTTVQSDGSWSFRLPEGAELADGAYDFQLSAQDVAGNATASGTSVLGGVEIDTTAPLLGASVNLTVDSFNPAMNGTDADFITSDNQFELSGTADNDATVRVYLGNVLIGTTTPAGGAWTFAAGDFDFHSLSVPGNNAVLADGNYDLTVVAIDDAGNESTRIETALVIDSAIDAPTLSIDGLIASSDGENYIGDDSPEFTVGGEAYSTGTFTLTDESTGLAVADPLQVRWDPDTDSYTFTSPSTLADGAYLATFTNMDAAGNQSTTTLEFIVDTSRPPSPVLSVTDTGSTQSPADPVTNNPALTVSFAAGANTANIQEVRVYLDGDNPPDLDNDTYYLATKQGDAWVLAPQFNAELRAALNAGYDGTTEDYAYTVVVVNRAGATDKASGEAYESTTFIYDTTPPELADIELATDDNNPSFDGSPDDYKVEPSDASLSDDDRAVVDTVGDPIYVVPVNPTFGGSCEAGCSVTVILGDDADTDPTQTLNTSSGSWSIRFGDNAQSETFALTKGEMNKVTILSTDKAGNVTEEVLYIKVAGDPPAAPSVDLSDAYNTGSVNDDVTRGADGTDPGDATDRDGLIRIHGNAPGASYVVITYVDENGVTQTVRTDTGSERIAVRDGLWESPEVLLTDTADTAHLGSGYTFSVTAYDAANQPSAATSYTATIDRSTTTPTIDLVSDSSGPASGYPTLDYGARSGTADDRTSLAVENNVLTLKGANAEDGSTVWLVHTYNGVTQALSFDEYKDTVLEQGAETGTWSIALDSADARILNIGLDGAHTFVVRTMDKAGNVADSAPLTVDFDSTAPALGGTALDAANNTAMDQRFVDANASLAALNEQYAEDAVTRSPDFTLTGSLDAEATDEADNVAVRVFQGAFQIGVADVSTDGDGNVTWSYDFSSGLAPGGSQDYTFHVEVTDRAGNTTVGDDFTVTVDRTPPVISGFELLDATDSFYDAADPADDLGSNTDNYTRSSTLTLAGSSAVSAPVLLEYSTDGGATYASLFAIPNGSSASSGANWTQDGGGHWTYTVSVDDLRSGLGAAATESVLFRATASDLAGNETASVFSVSVDRHAPTGTTVGLDAGSDSMDAISGQAGEAAIGSASDGRTNADTITLKGAAEAGARVEIYRVDPGSDYSEAHPGTLLDVVTANAATGAWSLAHTLDTDPAGGVDADGEYEFVAVTVDKAGNRGAAVIETVHRDTVVDVVPTLALNDESHTNAANPADAGGAADNPLVTAGTVRLDGDGHAYIDKSSITLEGVLTGYDASAEPVAAYVYQNGALAGQATITGDAWSFDVTTLADGASYAFTLVVEDSAGNTTRTAPLYVEIDASTAAPGLDLVDADDTSGSYFHSGAADPSAGTEDNVTATDRTQTGLADPDNAFTLQGTVAEAGSTITLYVARALGDGVYSDYEAVTGAVVQPAADGTAWSCTVLDADLSAGDGTYRFKAVATDLSGNTNEDTLDIVVDNQAPSLLHNYELWLDNDSGAQDRKTNTDTLELHGRLSDTSDRDIALYVREDGGEAIRVTDINWTTGEWSLEYAGPGGASLPEGGYSFVLYAEDRAGNLTTYPAAGSFDVLVDRTLDRPTIALSGDANTYGGPARVDVNNDGQPDGASDDYTGFAAANGTDIHLDITADPDAAVSVYVKNPASGSQAVDLDTLGDPGSGYDLVQAGIRYNSAEGKWDVFVFDGSGYQDQTSAVTLVVVADDGSQSEYGTYTFTLDDEPPSVTPGNGIDWEPTSATATHITDGAVVENATNGKSLTLSGEISGEGGDAVTVEIFDATKSTLDGGFGARVSLGMATVNNAGEWTFQAGSSASPLTEAYHLFTARIEDSAGNVTEVALDEILVDRSTPSAPALAMTGTEDTDYTDGVPADGYYLDDRGTPSGLDDIRYNDNNQPQFRLTGLETLPGSVLTIVVDGGAPQEIAVTDASRNFIPPILANGAHSVAAYVTDAAGNESAHAVLNFVVDTVAPAIDQVILEPDSNTGGADDAAAPVTRAEHPEISGASEAKAAITVELRDDKGTADTADDTVYMAETLAGDDGAWSVTVPSGTAIEEGNYDVTVTAVDRAGNTSVEEDVLSFEVNREVSLTPGSFQMVENAVNDTGFSDSDHYTANTGPSFSWVAQEEVTARFVIYKNGIASPIRTIVADAADLTTTGGVTTWTPSNLDLADGAYTIKAIFTDTEAGNETALNDNTATFTVDTTSTALSADLASDSGVQDDWVTNPEVAGDAETVTITGSAPSGSSPATEVRVQVYALGADDSRTLLAPSGSADGYVVTGADGAWSYTIDADAFSVGENELVIVSTDLAGNTTEIGRTLTIDVDATPGTVVLDAASNSGVYAADGDFIDNRTNDTEPTLTGAAEPNSTVDLWLGDPDAGGTLIGSDIPADANGKWSFDVGDWGTLADTSADLNGTSYTFTARVTDRAGNVADATGTVVIDAQAPDVSESYGRILPTPVTVGSQTVYSDTGLDHTDGYTSDTTPTLIGEVAESHSRVDVYVTYPGDADPTFIGTTKADANGNWQLEFPNTAAPLTGSVLGADHQVSVRTWDDAGNESGFSAARTITIDTSVGNPDAGLADGEVARIRFSADFDAANPPSGESDPVHYDPADGTLKTNLTTPSFDITLEPDCDTATLTLIRLGEDGNPVENPVADTDIFVINLGPEHADNPPADGLWTNVAFTTSDGQDVNINGDWLLTLTGTDKAGNEFTLEGGQALTVNGIPPEFTLEIVEDRAGVEGHGLFAGDDIVNAAGVHFSGTFGDDVDWREISSVSIIRAVDSAVVNTLDGDDITGPTWTMEATSVVDGGSTSYSYFVKAVDNFGNEFWYPSAGEPLTYTVDRNAPMLNEGSVDLTADDDTAGLFRATDGDNATAETEPRITFGSEANAKIELLIDGQVKFTAMPPDPSDDGAGYTFALDGGDLESGLPAGIAYNAATNRYTYTCDTLAEGDYVFTLRSTDLAGNVSTRDLTVTVDRTYDNANLTADLSSTSDQGSFGDHVVAHDDNLSNDEYPELTGSAEAGSAVRIYLRRFDTRAEAETDATFTVTGDDWYDDTPHHEIVLGDGETSWSWDAADPASGAELADGYYKVIVASEDQAGNMPDPEVFVFGKDTDAPSEADDAAPLTFHLQDQFEGDGLNEGSATDGEVRLGDVLDADGDRIWVTTNWMPTIGGTAEYGSRVSITLRIDGDLDGALDDPTAVYKQLTIDVTDPSGAWSFDFSGEETGAGRLADGVYTATVTCTDPAGNATTLSPSPQFQISSIPPSPPTIRLDQADDTYNSETSNDGVTKQNTGLTLTGTAEAGAVVRIYSSEAMADTYGLITADYLAAHLLATVTANASGEWSYELPTDFEADNQDSDVVEDGAYRFFVASDYFNGNTYYSIQETNDKGQAVINSDGTPVLAAPVEVDDGVYTYPDYVMEVDTELKDPTFELGLILDTTSGGTEEERRSNSSRMDSGIDNEWRTPEEVAAGVYLGQADDFWETPEDLAGHGTYDDWIVKTSGPTIEGDVEAGSIVYVQRYMAADFTDDGLDNPVDQWVTVGIVDRNSTAEGTWRFVFPAEYENAEYLVRIHVVDKAGNEYTSPEKTIVIDAAIRDTVLDLPDDQDTALHWAGVALGTDWDDIAATATLEGLDYVQKRHLPSTFESGVGDDLTVENNLLLHGQVEAGSRMYLTDTRQGVTVSITPVLIVDPAQALGDDTATEAYYVKVDDAGDVGAWTWMSADDFTATYGADYAGVYFHIRDDGTWDYRTGELADVKHAYTIENIDLAGNRAVTTPLSVTIDHDFSNAGIALSMSSDTGPFGNNDPAYDDRITSDGTPSFRLYGDSGATYLVYAFHVDADGNVTDNINADGSPVATGVYGEGSDTYVEIPLADGGYQLRLVNISESGHVSEAIYPPTEADGTYVTDADWDVGSSTHPLVIDTLDPVIPDRAALEATPGYYVHVKDEDPADPANAWTEEVTVGGRVLPVIISGDATDVDGTGVLSADLITTDSTPIIQILVEPGTMIAVSGMGYASYLTDSDNDGVITLNPSSERNDGNPYVNGTYDLTVRFGDIAGNVSDPNPITFSVTIDSAGPGSGIGLDTPSDTGTSTVDNLTRDTTPTLSGTVSTDAIRYEIHIGGLTIERHIGDADFGVLSDGHYAWTYTPTEALANGEYAVSISAWDRAGNSSGGSLSAYQTDDPNTVTGNVPLIIHDTDQLPLYANCEINRSGTRIYLDIDYSVSDAYNNDGNAYAGTNELRFTYHYTDGTSSSEVVEMQLGESDYSNSLRTDDNYASIDFQLVDSAGNASAVGHVDISAGPDGDGVYHIDNITGDLDDIPETVGVDFDLGGGLEDDNLTDALTVDDVDIVRATVSGDLDGDGAAESATVDATVNNDGSWALHFTKELAVGDYHLNLTGLSADGCAVTLASTVDLGYDFRVLAESMLADPGDSQVLFNEAAENAEPAGADVPDPGAVDTVTIDAPHVVIEEHVL